MTHDIDRPATRSVVNSYDGPPPNNDHFIITIWQLELLDREQNNE